MLGGMGEEIVVPEAVRAMLLAGEGEEGKAWLEGLPGLVAAVRERWGVTLGRPFPGGNVAYVAPAETRSGVAVVVKIQLVTDETREEGAALRHWGPEAAVEVLDEAPDLGALLLERVEPGEPLASRSLEEKLRGIVDLLPRLWTRPAPAGHAFTPVEESLDGWFSILARPQDDPDLATLAREVGEAARVLREPDLDPVGHLAVVNRDFHPGNVLSARRVPWLVIDPKALVGEPAFDCGHLISELLRSAGTEHAGVVVRHLSDGLGLDPAHVRAWAAVRAAVNAVWQRETGFGDGTWEVACVRELLATSL